MSRAEGQGRASPHPPPLPGDLRKLSTRWQHWLLTLFLCSWAGRHCSGELTQKTGRPFLCCSFNL